MRVCSRELLAVSVIVLTGTKLHAVTDNSQGNPYLAIVERNVFGLKPPPVVAPPKPPEAPQLNVELTGIMTIFGKKQGLFLVQEPPQQGQPAKPPVTYILSEGERSDKLEVLAIDPKAGTAKISDAGREREIQFKKLPVSALPAPGLAAAQPGVPGVAPAMAAFNPAPGGSGSGGVTTIGAYQMPNRMVRTAPNNPGGFASIAPTHTAQVTPTAPPLSREEQEIMIEVNRQVYKDAGDPAAAILPPTSLTPTGGP
jgi:hypothetical protein